MYTKVPLLEPGTITLPIGPNHSIGPGKGEDKRIDLDESHVARLNARPGKRSGGLGGVSPGFGPEVVRGCGTARRVVDRRFPSATALGNPVRGYSADRTSRKILVRQAATTTASSGLFSSGPLK